MSRALILGGGGITGIAWEAGVLLGLAEAGFDASDWDLVVGTSAGSVVGAKVLAEPDFAGFVARQLIEAGPEEDEPIRQMGGRFAAAALRLGRRRLLGWLPNAWLMGFAAETFVRQHARRRRRSTAPVPGYRQIHGPNVMLERLGTYGLAARTAPESIYRQVIAATLDPVRDWPERLVATVVDVDTGAGYALDKASGVPFVDAIAASCAVPGFMPMVTIGGRMFMDGGMASQTHADLAAGFDEVVVIAPLDLGALGTEVRRLREAGTRITLVSPGPEGRRIIGRHVKLLDPARRARAAQAGLLDGRRAAETLGGTPETPPSRGVVDAIARRAGITPGS